MLNSRDITKLRTDVAANCHKLIELARAQGLDVLVTGTVRDDEYQLSVFNQGYSKSRTPSFHSVKAGLAFDVCKNLKGHEYDDETFWRKVGAIGKQLGFTWGGDWKSFTDKPHFQWDNNGKVTSTMVRNYQYPPFMAEYTDAVSILVNSIATKYGLSSPQYWMDVINGKVVVSKDNIKALFEKFNK